MFKEYPFSIKGNRLHQSGVSYGYGDADPYLIDYGKRYAVIKEPGSFDWFGRGETAYYPATWYLVEFEFVGRKMKVFRIIEEVQPGKKWASCKKELLKKMEVLEKEIEETL